MLRDFGCPRSSNTNAVQRADGGCTDTDSNSADFSTGAPNPRNTNSPAHLCGGVQTKAGVGISQTETGASLFVSEGTLPFLFVSYFFEDFSAQRPRGGLTRWRRVAL